MSNITELALLVSKAKASVFTLGHISQFEPADIDSDDVDLRFEVDGRDTGTNVSIVDECGQAAEVIGALVEALEKAQRYIKELREWNAGLAQESFTYQKRIAETNKRNAELTAKIEPMDRQVDELTMWVKRLARSLRNARPDSKLHSDAMDYLSRNGLISVEDVLR